MSDFIRSIPVDSNTASMVPDDGEKLWNAAMLSPKPVADSKATTAGVATFYLTSDKTISGTILFSSVQQIQIQVPDSTLGGFSFSYTISGDLKTLTVTVTRNTFTGVVVLGIPVIGSVAVSNVPNGTRVEILAFGTYA